MIEYTSALCHMKAATLVDLCAGATSYQHVRLADNTGELPCNIAMAKPTHQNQCSEQLTLENLECRVTGRKPVRVIHRQFITSMLGNMQMDRRVNIRCSAIERRPGEANK